MNCTEGFTPSEALCLFNIAHKKRGCPKSRYEEIQTYKLKALADLPLQTSPKGAA
ncbi:hypothetical protein BC643_4645 [Mangrovibacterium diazotrophicum]|uniref:Uncharacterized protein n=1 Tax=Mangrovibacterium diazotrophicum TaxID=1261403 RepID=A0A419VUJ7_9BACT|nr:hypothetical protein BC643_4645 [Mangrovibacterium diazotrophicum]